jgi:hypothetical protein
MSTKTFQVTDYVLFALVLGFSVFIGLYYALKRFLLSYYRKYFKHVENSNEKNKSELAEYLTANRSMGVWLNSISKYTFTCTTVGALVF